MEITDQVREAVMKEIIAELKEYGHSYAAVHVNNCRKRLSIRMANRTPREAAKVAAS